MNDFNRGDHVKKKQGFKFIGTILYVYADWEMNDWYAVVQLDKNEASDGLHHIYKLSQLEKI